MIADIKQNAVISAIDNFIEEADKFKNLDSFIPVVLSNLQKYKKVVEEPFRLAVIGETKSGKSTFINSVLIANEAIDHILIEDQLLPEGFTPTDAVITELHYGEHIKAEILMGTKKKEIAINEKEDLKSLWEYIKHQEDKIKREETIIKLFLPCKELTNLVMVNTPGFNSPYELDDKVVYEYLPKVNAAIWIFDATQAGSEIEKSLIEELKEYSKSIVGVINKIDQEESQENIEKIKDWISVNFSKEMVKNRVFLYSAKKVKEILKNGFDEKELDRWGYLSLIKFLREEFFDNVKGLRAQKIKSILGGMEKELNKLNKICVKEIEQIKGELEKLYERKSLENEYIKETLYPAKRRIEEKIEFIISNEIKKLRELYFEVSYNEIERITGKISSYFRKKDKLKEEVMKRVKEKTKHEVEKIQDKIQKEVKELMESEFTIALLERLPVKIKPEIAPEEIKNMIADVINDIWQKIGIISILLVIAQFIPGPIDDIIIIILGSLTLRRKLVELKSKLYTEMKIAFKRTEEKVCEEFKKVFGEAFEKIKDKMLEKIKGIDKKIIELEENKDKWTELRKLTRRTMDVIKEEEQCLR